MMQWYKIEPLDTLLFREAKPFSPGEGAWAKGMFPPMPTVVFQALRLCLALTDEVAQTSNRERQLKFIGPFLLKYTPDGEELWLPTPKDLLCVKKYSENQQDNEEDSENWSRLVCLQPLDTKAPEWKYISYGSGSLSQEITPMIPPPISDNADIGTELDIRGKREFICGRPKPWIKASALISYLQGEKLTNHDDFHDDPWSVQVLPHIHMKPGTRQVKDEDGYFTEVAIRLHTNWKLVAAISGIVESNVVRLGGEGHRAFVSPIDLPVWEQIEGFIQASNGKKKAYLLTPGLAEAQPEQSIYGVYPDTWRQYLHSCASDKAILWGGKSSLSKTPMLPQRAFVPPGTVYLFQESANDIGRVLPNNYLQSQIKHNQEARESKKSDEIDPKVRWLDALFTLNYGILLWSK